MKLTEEELKEQLELYAEKNDELRARNQELERQLTESEKMIVAAKEEVRMLDNAIRKLNTEKANLERGILKIIPLIGE